MSESKPILDLPTKTKDSGSQAREQSAEYGGIFDATPLVLDDGSIIHVPPDPRWRLLDDDQMEAYDALLYEAESYDRGEEIVIPKREIKNEHGHVERTWPEETQPGPLLVPYRKTDEDGNTTLISPAWEVRLVQAALGPDDYARLRAGKINGQRGSIRHIQHIWTEHNRQIQERRAADSKSARSTVDLETVPEADSSGAETEGDSS